MEKPYSHNQSLGLSALITNSHELLFFYFAAANGFIARLFEPIGRALHERQVFAMNGGFWTMSGGFSSWAAELVDPKPLALVGEPAAAHRQHLVDRRIHLELPLIAAS